MNPRAVSTMTADRDTAPARAVAVDPPRGVRWLPAVWMGVAAAPFLVAAARAADRPIALGADFALSALASSDAAHLDQLVGPYSRMGWSHPGPAWFYLLAPVFTLLGSSGAALYASFLGVQALAAALVVAAAGRGQAWAQPVAALAVLVYGLRVPTIILVNPWNPFALLLPTMLLLLLAGRAAAGSLSALAGTVAVGTFLVQTHVGTAPLVAAAGAVAAVGWLFTRPRPGVPARRASTIAGFGLAVLWWLPPLWQQFHAPADQGNLYQLAQYFTQPGGGEGQAHTWTQAAVATGRLLGVPVYGWSAGDQLVDVDHLHPAGAALLVVQGLGTLLLAFAAWRVRNRPAAALAAVLAAAEIATLFAIHSLRGDVYDYLTLWATVLPVVLAYGWATLLLRHSRLTRPATIVAVTLVAVLAIVLGRQTTTLVGRLPDTPGVREAVELIDGHLGDRADPIQLDIAAPGAWPTATGVAQILENQGYRVHVNDTWAHLFGASRELTGDERVRVLFVDADQPVDDQLPPARGIVVGELGRWAVIVTAVPAR
ncbi:MAG: hypothetical protein JWP46_1970 [Modestobacter sp.]|nr:hypothetical protein [Modestobacter sp.]